MLHAGFVPVSPKRCSGAKEGSKSSNSEDQGALQAETAGPRTPQHGGKVEERMSESYVIKKAVHRLKNYHSPIPATQ